MTQPFLKRLAAAFGIGEGDRPYAITPYSSRRIFKPAFLLEGADGAHLADSELDLLDADAAAFAADDGEAEASTALLQAERSGLEPAMPPAGNAATAPDTAAFPAERTVPPAEIDFLTSRLRDSSRRLAIIDAFDAAHPVNRRDGLLGRERHLTKLFDGVIERHEHAIIYGNRGSGKTSLARIFGDYADQQGALVVYLLCEPATEFAAVMRPFFDYVPSYALKASAVDQRIIANPGHFTSFLAENLEQRVILILDEFDRIEDPGLQSQMATFMKLLADASVTLQLCLVGIAASRDDLIGYHPSLRRHMTAVGVDRLADQDCAGIVERGARLAGITFAPDAQALLLKAAAGSPYHVRLFCQAAGQVMLRRGGQVIDLAIAREGLAEALEDWGELNSSDFATF